MRENNKENPRKTINIKSLNELNQKNGKNDKFSKHEENSQDLSKWMNITYEYPNEIHEKEDTLAIKKLKKEFENTDQELKKHISELEELHRKVEKKIDNAYEKLNKKIENDKNKGKRDNSPQEFHKLHHTVTNFGKVIYEEEDPVGYEEEDPVGYEKKSNNTEDKNKTFFQKLRDFFKDIINKAKKTLGFKSDNVNKLQPTTNKDQMRKNKTYTPTPTPTPNAPQNDKKLGLSS